MKIFACVMLIICILCSCSCSEISIDQYPQNIVVQSGQAVDDENYVYFTDSEENYVINILDKNTKTIISTGIRGGNLSIKDEFLYFTAFPPPAICRINKNELMSNVDSSDFNIETLPLAFAEYNFVIYDDTIHYSCYYGNIVSTDLNGENEEYFNEEFICGYEKGISYYAAFMKDNYSENSISGTYIISSRKNNKSTELFKIVCDGHKHAFNDFLCIYNGYGYYIVDNVLYRNKMQKNSTQELIYNKSAKLSHSFGLYTNLMGITSTGIYIHDSNDVYCISYDGKEVKKCDIVYNADYIYFLSNIDKELYALDDNNIVKIQ